MNYAGNERPPAFESTAQVSQNYFLTHPAGLEPVGDGSQWQPDKTSYPEVVQPDTAVNPLKAAQTDTNVNPTPQAVHPAPQARSFFEHDDSSSNVNNRKAFSHFGQVARDTPSDSSHEPQKITTYRKALITLVTFLIVLGLIGTVLATTLSTQSRHESDSTILPPTNSSDSDIGILSRTQLATANAGSSSGFHVVLFQNEDGGLDAIESRGSGREVYTLSSRFDNEDCPKPVDGSPFVIEKFGSDGDLHLFYFDDALKFAHIVRRARKSGKGSWELGSISASDVGKDLESADGDMRRLSVTTLPGDWANMGHELMMVMYQTSGGRDTVQLLTSHSPDDAAAWSKQSFSLGTEAIGLEMHPSSPGFLILPIERQPNGDEEETVAGVRLMWDLNNDSNKATFGMLDCTLTEEKSLGQCMEAPNNWNDTAAEDLILDASKPLRFTNLAGENHEAGEGAQILVRVLDSKGNMTELLWETDAWVAHSTFSVDQSTLPHNATTFTASCSTDDGIMYGLSDGKLYDFARTGFWWKEGEEETGWEFIGALDSTVGEKAKALPQPTAAM